MPADTSPAGALYVAGFITHQCSQDDLLSYYGHYFLGAGWTYDRSISHDLPVEAPSFDPGIISDHWYCNHDVKPPVSITVIVSTLNKADPKPRTTKQAYFALVDNKPNQVSGYACKG